MPPPLAYLPPLAMFQNDGRDGPFTITADGVQQLIGAQAGVVSLPATYAHHPILWGALAHEVAGHDITHATPGLLDELERGIPAAFASSAVPHNISREQLCHLWSYWLGEATADVYGILNMGPAFVLNQAAFFAALLAEGKNRHPKLRMKSGFCADDPSKTLDPHPTDILRLHLAAGVIDTLSHLSEDDRHTYNNLIERLSVSLANGVKSIQIEGNLPLERDHLQWMNLDLDLSEMQMAARHVGTYIAKTRLSALGGHPIQDIETWDDCDEERSREVTRALLKDNPDPIGNLGDDAQLLAGATMALLYEPDLYDKVTEELNKGLDLSFQRDPIWGTPRSDRVFIRYDH